VLLRIGTTKVFIAPLSLPQRRDPARLVEIMDATVAFVSPLVRIRSTDHSGALNEHAAKHEK